MILHATHTATCILQETNLAEYAQDFTEELEEIINNEDLPNIDKTTAIMAALSIKGAKAKQTIFNILEESTY